MNLLLFGKYPPIQGGVSSSTYWLMKALAERGHKIHVVSNFSEAEGEDLVRFFGKDRAFLAHKNITLHSTGGTKLPPFIPFYNPYGEKLVSLGLEVVEKYDIDLIFGWYLLPYGVAANVLSKMTGVPYVTRHAGSDISKLFQHPELHPLLLRVLRDSSAVFGTPTSKKPLEDYGCRIVHGWRTPIPDEFSPNGKKVNLEAFFGLKKKPKKTLLFLGKLHAGKGVQSMIRALRHDGSGAVTMLCLGNGGMRQEFEELASRLKVDKVHFRDAVAPWRVPAFMRSVDGVVVPQYRFGVAGHVTRIPFEAMLCGKPVFLSSELAAKYSRYQEMFVEIDPARPRDVLRRITSTLNGSPSDRSSEARVMNGSFDEYVSRVESAMMAIGGRRA